MRRRAVESFGGVGCLDERSDNSSTIPKSGGQKIQKNKAATYTYLRNKARQSSRDSIRAGMLGMSVLNVSAMTFQLERNGSSSIRARRPLRVQIRYAMLQISKLRRVSMRRV